MRRLIACVRAVLVLAALFCVNLPSVFAANLLGISGDGSVFSIDETDGSGSLLGSSGFAGVNSLARSSTGQFVSVSRGVLDPNATLFAVDPATGLGTGLANLDFGKDIDISVRAMTFADDRLYAINNGGGRFSTLAPDDLYVVNGSGAGTFIGSTGFTGIQGLTTAPDGKLYAWDLGSFDPADGSGLLIIDPASGAATDLDSTIGETEGVDIQTLAFGPDGKLYGGRDSLYLIDPATGSTTLVGSGNYADIRGFEFLAAPNQEPVGNGGKPGQPPYAPTPEPSGLILAGLALAGSVARSRKKA
jgi:PEP-CTERM motif